jgi:gas vesicle protein
MRTIRDMIATGAVLLASVINDTAGVDRWIQRRRAQAKTAGPVYSQVAILGTGVLGAAVGAGLAMLFAPQSGPKTRERLREMANGMRDRTVNTATNLRARAEDVMERGREVMAEKRTMVSTALQAGREALQRERDRLGAA